MTGGGGSSSGSMRSTSESEKKEKNGRSGEIDTAHDKSLFLLIKSLVRVGWREGDELTTGKGDIRANQRVGR